MGGKEDGQIWEELMEGNEYGQNILYKLKKRKKIGNHFHWRQEANFLTGLRALKPTGSMRKASENERLKVL